MALTKVGKEGITGISNSSDATAITIDSSENVGIGTSSPNVKLHLKADDPTIFLEDNSPDDARGASIHSAAGDLFLRTGDDLDTGSPTVNSEVVLTDGNNIIFRNNASTERMRLNSDGNLGINESSPDTKLHVSNNASATPLATFECTASHEASIRFKSAHSSSSDFRVGASISASNNFEIYSVGAATARLKIGSAGDLFVQRVYDNTTGGSANVVVSSNGQFLRSTSSQRYKNTINDATHGLTELLTLRSVTYKGNNDGDTVFGGLIAEEVHDAGLTEFVQYNDDGEPDALAYGNMVSLCIKAIQELSAKVTTLETEKTALETRIETLENA